MPVLIRGAGGGASKISNAIETTGFVEQAVDANNFAPVSRLPMSYNTGGLGTGIVWIKKLTNNLFYACIYDYWGSNQSYTFLELGSDGVMRFKYMTGGLTIAGKGTSSEYGNPIFDIDDTHFVHIDISNPLTSIVVYLKYFTSLPSAGTMASAYAQTPLALSGSNMGFGSCWFDKAAKQILVAYGDKSNLRFSVFTVNTASHTITHTATTTIALSALIGKSLYYGFIGSITIKKVGGKFVISFQVSDSVYDSNKDRDVQVYYRYVGVLGLSLSGSTLTLTVDNITLRTDVQAYGDSKCGEHCVFFPDVSGGQVVLLPICIPGSYAQTFPPVDPSTITTTNMAFLPVWVSNDGTSYSYADTLVYMGCVRNSGCRFNGGDNNVLLENDLVLYFPNGAGFYVLKFQCTMAGGKPVVTWSAVPGLMKIADYTNDSMYQYLLNKATGYCWSSLAGSACVAKINGQYMIYQYGYFAAGSGSYYQTSTSAIFNLSDVPLVVNPRKLPAAVTPSPITTGIAKKAGTYGSTIGVSIPNF